MLIMARPKVFLKFECISMAEADRRHWTDTAVMVAASEKNTRSKQQQWQYKRRIMTAVIFLKLKVMLDRYCVDRANE